MRRYWQQIVALLAIITLCGCENTTFRSSVPTYPVRLSVDTRTGQFVHFVPENVYDFITVDKQGYHYHDYHLALAATDMIGYAGIVIYIDGSGNYTAFDRCCTHCLDPNHPTIVDGFYATCPVCGEAYDLSWGIANPTKGLSKESLRRYRVINSGGKLTVSQ